MFSFLAYALPLAMAVLGILAGSYECWNKERHRPTKLGIVLLSSILLITFAQIVISHAQEENKNRVHISAQIALANLQNVFDFYSKRCFEAMQGNYYFYEGDKDAFMQALRLAPYSIAEEIKDNKKALIAAGMNSGMADDFEGIFTHTYQDYQTIPDDELPRSLEYMIRISRERLFKELLKGELASNSHD
ncbi:MULTISPECIES: hypothetical protein [Pseudoalteromonas]|uniref:hypothetical protein n=1 Tax=Pseudoalteromonas TaxID=53246 RepID=UPI00029B0E19|nr:MULTISPECIES: hypothetical protein [Pseudoalteromonas]AUJ72453.1 hypothetical protein PNC201_21185 [Pseudoalteromonas sp. NC201]MCG7556118.1 hypothetical protein [Pseudoalteromonas sp. Of11M-6]